LWFLHHAYSVRFPQKHPDPRTWAIEYWGTLWSDGSGGTVRWTSRLNLTPGQTTRTDTTTPVGAIPAAVIPSAGAYQDTVAATVISL
jgi:spore coat protein U-like protein